jgi:hypothetical protein
MAGNVLLMMSKVAHLRTSSKKEMVTKALDDYPIKLKDVLFGNAYAVLIESLESTKSVANDDTIAVFEGQSVIDASKFDMVFNVNATMKDVHRALEILYGPDHEKGIVKWSISVVVELLVLLNKIIKINGNVFPISTITEKVKNCETLKKVDMLEVAKGLDLMGFSFKDNTIEQVCEELFKQGIGHITGIDPCISNNTNASNVSKKTNASNVSNVSNVSKKTNASNVSKQTNASKQIIAPLFEQNQVPVDGHIVDGVKGFLYYAYNCVLSADAQANGGNEMEYKLDVVQRAPELINLYKMLLALALVMRAGKITRNGNGEWAIVSSIDASMMFSAFHRLKKVDPANHIIVVGSGIDGGHVSRKMLGLVYAMNKHDDKDGIEQAVAQAMLLDIKLDDIGLTQDGGRIKIRIKAISLTLVNLRNVARANGVAYSGLTKNELITSLKRLKCKKNN